MSARVSSASLLSQGSIWLTELARESTRDNARLTVNLAQDVIDQLNNDPSCRIMVFCASEAFGPYSRDASDIAFPHNVELKCNGDEVKANLRGLKNRPGSTRPADITSMIRTKPTNYPNSVEMVYALTTKVSQTTSIQYSISSVSDLTSELSMLNRSTLKCRNSFWLSTLYPKRPSTRW